MLVALAGGVGAARFLRGLVQVCPPRDIVVIGNTGDDLEMHGLSVSPDLDSVMYTLAGAADDERGWGMAGETWAVRDALVRLGEPGWFGLGDRDLATHLLRTRLLREGVLLDAVTAELCRRFGVEVRLIPMSNESVRTRITISTGGSPPALASPRSAAAAPDATSAACGGERVEMGFQEYWVGRGAFDPVVGVRFAGAERASAAPGVLEAIANADGIIICPSNPVASIGPILAVPGMSDAIKAAACRTVAISPIVGGRVLRGMADRLLPVWGAEVSARGVGALYSTIIDALVIDDSDAAATESVEAQGIECITAPSIMHSVDDAAVLAAVVLRALRSS